MTEGRALAPTRLWLLGAMGAGKSSVGRALAGRLGWPLLDNDEELLRRTSRTAEDLASVDPAGLHVAEADQLRAAVATPPPFVADAAASVADQPELLHLLAATGTVVLLRARVDTLIRRIGTGAGRPALGAAPALWLAGTVPSRDLAAAAVAHLVVDVDDLTVDQVADHVLARLGWTEAVVGDVGPPG